MAWELIWVWLHTKREILDPFSSIMLLSGVRCQGPDLNLTALWPLWPLSFRTYFQNQIDLLFAAFYLSWSHSTQRNVYGCFFYPFRLVTRDQASPGTSLNLSDLVLIVSVGNWRAALHQHLTTLNVSVSNQKVAAFYVLWMATLSPLLRWFNPDKIFICAVCWLVV